MLLHNQLATLAVAAGLWPNRDNDNKLMMNLSRHNKIYSDRSVKKLPLTAAEGRVSKTTFLRPCEDLRLLYVYSSTHRQMRVKSCPLTGTDIKPQIRTLHTHTPYACKYKPLSDLYALYAKHSLFQ